MACDQSVGVTARVAATRRPIRRRIDGESAGNTCRSREWATGSTKATASDAQKAENRFMR